MKQIPTRLVSEKRFMLHVLDSEGKTIHEFDLEKEQEKEVQGLKVRIQPEIKPREILGRKQKNVGLTIGDKKYAFVLHSSNNHLFVKPDPERKSLTLSQRIAPDSTNTLEDLKFKFLVRQAKKR